jgi:hypothetical protein
MVLVLVPDSVSMRLVVVVLVSVSAALSVSVSARLSSLSRRRFLPPSVEVKWMLVGHLWSTEIVQDEKFLQEFLDEWYFFGLIGPLNPDENSFITRWALRMGYKIKCESSEALYHHDFALLPAQSAP